MSKVEYYQCDWCKGQFSAIGPRPFDWCILYLGSYSGQKKLDFCNADCLAAYALTESEKRSA